MTDGPSNKHSTLRKIILGMVIFCLVFSSVSLISMKSFYDKNFPRVDRLNQNFGYLRFADVPQYAYRTVTFPSGENTLTGYVFGEENDQGLVVIAHGLGFGTVDYLAETLYFVDQGWRVFVYDCTGTDESEGKSTLGLPQSVLDLDAALQFIGNDAALMDLPVMLYGHSWGAYAVTAILNDDNEISAVASIAGYNSPDELVTEQTVSTLGGLGYIEAPFGWAYQKILFGNTAGLTAVDGINRSDVPVMIIHGTEDESISYDGASIISHQDQITNPNVVYKTCSTTNHNGHNSLFVSEAARLYIDELNQAYNVLSDQYDGNIPQDVLTQYYAGIDRFRTSELDVDFMNEINSFFENALQG